MTPDTKSENDRASATEESPRSVFRRNRNAVSDFQLRELAVVGARQGWNCLHRAYGNQELCLRWICA